MGTEVLRPQDCLIEQVRVVPAAFHRQKSYQGYHGYGNGYPKASNDNSHHRKTAVRSDRSKQKRRFSSSPEPMISKRSSSAEDLRSGSRSLNQIGQTQNLVMGRVTILRRGESLDSMIKSSHLPASAPAKDGGDLMVCGTGRLGPDPEIVPKQIRIKDLKSVFPPVTTAGGRSSVYAGSAFSMSPSPSSLPLPTFFNKKASSKSVDDPATRDLRRLLRLE